MSTEPNRKIRLIADLLLLAAAQVSTYYVIKYLLRKLDPQSDEKEEARVRSNAVLRRLEAADESSTDEKLQANRDSSAPPKKRKKKIPTSLNTYEQSVLMSVVAPEDIDVKFSDVGGLESIKSDIKETVLMPLNHPHLYAAHSSLLTAPKGVLLYGPPGCGKTMMAKALAAESGAVFINMHISTLTDKWYGDSNKLVAAMFSLARKLAPSIIFIDELDALFRTRTSSDHEASAQLKAEIMTQWDGLLSNRDAEQQVVVLGATNRKDDIDPAILRRMPLRFAIPMPSAMQRRAILELLLRDTKMDEDFSMDQLVLSTAGLSGSDLKEACRDAAMVPVREYIRSRTSQGVSLEESIEPGSEGVRKVRGVRNYDFFHREERERQALEESWRESQRSMSETEAGSRLEEVVD